MHLTHQKYPLLCLKSNHPFKTSPISILQYKYFQKVEFKTLPLYWQTHLFQSVNFFCKTFDKLFFCKIFTTTLHRIFSQRRHDIKCNVKGKFYAFIELKMKVLYVYIPSAFSLSNTIYIILLYFSHIFSQ